MSNTRDEKVCDLCECSALDREIHLFGFWCLLWVYVQSSGEGILKVVLCVARSVSRVFDVDVSGRKMS